MGCGKDQLPTVEEQIMILRRRAEAEKAVVSEIASRVHVRLSPEVRLLEAAIGQELVKSALDDWAALYVLSHTSGDDLVGYLNQGIGFVTENVQALMADTAGLVRQILDECLSIPQPSVDVICLRYGFQGNPKTRREVAQELGVSYVTVRLRELKGLWKLRWAGREKLRAVLELWSDRLFERGYSYLEECGTRPTQTLIHAASQWASSRLSDSQKKLRDLETTLNSLKSFFPWLDLPIGQLGLSVGALRTLGRADIKTIGDLIVRRKQLREVRDLGPRRLAEIEAKLVEFCGGKVDEKNVA